MEQNQINSVTRALGRHLLVSGMSVPDVAKELRLPDFGWVYTWDTELRAEGKLGMF